MTVYLVIYGLCAFIACLILIYLRLPTDVKDAAEVGVVSLFWFVLVAGLILTSICLLTWRYVLDPLILLYTTKPEKEEEQG